MKRITKCVMFQLVLVFAFVSLVTHGQAAEMDVDVGIEFTEIEPEPVPEAEAEEETAESIPEPQAKPPIKKVIQLPQTGEQKSQGFTMVGAFLMISVGVFIYRKKSGVVKE